MKTENSKTKLTKAIKLHYCDNCGSPINKGELYVYKKILPSEAEKQGLIDVTKPFITKVCQRCVFRNENRT